MPHRVLIVDDNPETCRYLSQWLTIEFGDAVAVSTALDRDAGLRMLERADPPYAIVIADLWLPDAEQIRDVEGGLRILEAARRQRPPAEVILITGNSSAESALQASLTGAREYLIKPVEAERLIALVREILDERALPVEPSVPPPPPEEETPLIGASPAMIAVMQAVGRVAPTDVDVLLIGESGSGKELVARTIHANSPRAKGPFVVLNCSAIPRDLIEAELFGIERRVATEVDARPGKFMEAAGGTLFLDEIGDLAWEVQPKLLRALETKEIQRIGGRSLRCDVRILAATNQDLEAAVRAGTFRSDLYYRLQRVTIRIPPLRERQEDVPLLAEYFLRAAAGRFGKRVLGFEEGVLARLRALPWPGNVRELRNAVETAVLRSSGALVRAGDFPPELWAEADHSPLAEERLSLDQFLDAMAQRTLSAAVEEFERRLIQHVLRRNGGNVTRAARQLGIGRSSLHRKMTQLGIRRVGSDGSST